MNDIVDGYPIREFSRLTGVNPVTLRAWERRYGIIRPLRTAKGHRFYNDDHVSLVRNILYWLEQGYPIRQVRLLLQSPSDVRSAPEDDWSSQQQSLLAAAMQFSCRLLDELINDGLASYPMAVYWERCLLPVLNRLREDPAHGPVLRSFGYLLRRKLSQLTALQQKHAEGDALLLATNHEDGELQLLIIAYALGAAGFRVEYFGPHMHPDDIRIAVPVVSVSWLWLHLQPQNSDQVRDWLNISHDLTVPVYLSGNTEAPGSEHMRILPEQTGAMISQFITTSGERP